MHSLAFEVGIHYALLSYDWNELKKCPVANMIESNKIELLMDSLYESMNKLRSFQDTYSLKCLQKRMKKIDRRVAEEKRKSKLIQNLPNLPNIIITVVPAK
jgi:hypothetical protein